MVKVEQDGSGLDIFLNDRLVLSHNAETPFIEVAKGAFDVKGGGGKIAERVPLLSGTYDPERMLLRFSAGEYSMAIHVQEDEDKLILKFQRSSPKINRIFLSFPADPEFAVYGCGDHRGAADLRGKRVPVWVSQNENAAGMQKISFLKQIITRTKVKSSAFTMPFYVNSKFSFVYINTAAYTEMDFTAAVRRVEIRGIPESVTIGDAHNYAGLTENVLKLLGKQSMLPGWGTSGVWIDAHGGTAKVVETLERAIKSGVKVAALVLRDWSSGGDKPFWDWILNAGHYPRLDELIKELLQRDLHVLAYVNPQLSMEGRLFAEASKSGYLVKNEKNGNLLMDMGGFMAGLIDFTNPEACAWYKKIIIENILNVGFSGFIADMCGDFPHNAVFKSGESAESLHNRWPHIWARLSRDAIRESGRAAAMSVLSTGYSGSPGEAMLFSLSGQKPSWGAEDGLPNAVSASLSAGICGMGAVSSVIGGNPGGTMRKCSKELFMRWTEFAAFTPVMRISADADCGWRFDADDETSAHFSRMSKIHAALAPYFKQCIKESANNGFPMMRPLFFAFPGEEGLWGVDDEYMLGSDLIVAPIIRKKKLEREVRLPKGTWIHLWSGREYTANTVIEAPYGAPPVFYKGKSKFGELFESISKEFEKI